MRSLLLLWGLASLGVAAAQDVSTTPRPVREVTEAPRASEIRFVSFEFQQPVLYHALTVHYREIEGEPSAGEQYGVEASLGGQEALATLLFEAIDEEGNTIQPIPMVRHATGVAGHDEFIGMFTVPSRAFRVRLTGEDVYNQRFSRTYPRLFTPTTDPPQELLPPEFLRQAPPDVTREARQLLQILEEAQAERRATIVKNAGGRIVMPRTRVMNVRYAPLLSAAGRPLGVRITYETEFTGDGRYNPALRVYAEDREDSSVGRYPLHPLRGTIRPVPHETYAPLKEAEDIPGLLAHRADFLYKAGTRYTFELDLVPDFVKVLRDRITPCLWKQPPKYSEHERQAFARQLARQGPTTYTVWIGGRAFEGKIDGFYGEGTFYESLVAEGLAECEYPEYR